MLVEQNPILEALNLPVITAIQLTSMQLRMWGRDIQFNCLAGLVEFQIRFVDCREMRWQLYTHMQDEANPAFPISELVSIKLGRNQHRSPAHILSEHFGLSLVYGDLQLIQEDVVIPLGTE